MPDDFVMLKEFLYQFDRRNTMEPWRVPLIWIPDDLLILEATVKFTASRGDQEDTNPPTEPLITVNQCLYPNPGETDPVKGHTRVFHKLIPEFWGYQIITVGLKTKVAFELGSREYLKPHVVQSKGNLVRVFPIPRLNDETIELVEKHIKVVNSTLLT